MIFFFAAKMFKNGHFEGKPYGQKSCFKVWRWYFLRIKSVPTLSTAKQKKTRHSNFLVSLCAHNEFDCKLRKKFNRCDAIAKSGTAQRKIGFRLNIKCIRLECMICKLCVHINISNFMLTRQQTNIRIHTHARTAKHKFLVCTKMLNAVESFWKSY